MELALAYRQPGAARGHVSRLAARGAAVGLTAARGGRGQGARGPHPGQPPGEGDLARGVAAADPLPTDDTNPYAASSDEEVEAALLASEVADASDEANVWRLPLMVALTPYRHWRRTRLHLEAESEQQQPTRVTTRLIHVCTYTELRGSVHSLAFTRSKFGVQLRCTAQLSAFILFRTTQLSAAFFLLVF